MVFDEEELKKGQKLVTKLRNAFQFVKMLTPFRKGGSDSAFIAEERGDFVNEETTQEIPPTPLYERGR
ncbi:MAG: hypothetical protein LBI53_07435 [Candidatus Peribacteria bacterium]|nr:hypothetical protein [Candidatus Peribacteria bacterium]